MNIEATIDYFQGAITKLGIGSVLIIFAIIAIYQIYRFMGSGKSFISKLVQPVVDVDAALKNNDTYTVCFAGSQLTGLATMIVILVGSSMRSVMLGDKIWLWGLKGGIVIGFIVILAAALFRLFRYWDKISKNWDINEALRNQSTAIVVWYCIWWQLACFIAGFLGSSVIRTAFPGF